MKSLFLNCIVASHRSHVAKVTSGGREFTRLKNRARKTPTKRQERTASLCRSSQWFCSLLYLHSTKTRINSTSFPISFTHTLSPTSTISEGLSTRQEDMWVLWTRPGHGFGREEGGKIKTNLHWISVLPSRTAVSKVGWMWDYPLGRVSLINKTNKKNSAYFILSSSFFDFWFWVCF